ncbi:hypothetical protein DENSPDRAFT_930372 [Dentipellis sp. KUC8613]|nr:hypothetical protein DENSPDRAFT_930372 [Dentipellis sp. KUC8613]
MANTLKIPWIANYLVDLAETHGGNFSSMPMHERGKKVQIVQFLTWQRSADDDCIWARVSDKEHKISVRFTATALQQYEMLNMQDSQGHRLTAHRNALATIKRFKPCFRRVPDGAGHMTRDAVLALDVDEVDVLGSAGEPVFGNPRDVSLHPMLREWVDGLRQAGGGGNVLKLLKEVRDKAKEAKGDAPAPAPAHDLDIRKVMIAPKPALPRMNPAKEKERTKPQVSGLKQWTRSWDDVHKRPETLVHKPWDPPLPDPTAPRVAPNAFPTASHASVGHKRNRDGSPLMPSKRKRGTTPEPSITVEPATPVVADINSRPHPTTPSVWESSPSHRGHSPEPEPEHGDDPESSPHTRPPTPAQRQPARRRILPSSSPSILPSPIPPDASNPASSPSPPKPASSKPKSRNKSPTPAAHPTAHAGPTKKAASLPNMPATTTTASSFPFPAHKRHVPPPTRPGEQHEDGDGDRTRVLVPNSDTSGQSGALHSQSQSQSQSQGHSQSLGLSQGKDQGGESRILRALEIETTRAVVVAATGTIDEPEPPASLPVATYDSAIYARVRAALSPRSPLPSLPQDQDQNQNQDQEQRQSSLPPSPPTPSHPPVPAEESAPRGKLRGFRLDWTLERPPRAAPLPTWQEYADMARKARVYRVRKGQEV